MYIYTYISVYIYLYLNILIHIKHINIYQVFFEKKRIKSEDNFRIARPETEEFPLKCFYKIVNQLR